MSLTRKQGPLAFVCVLNEGGAVVDQSLRLAGVTKVFGGVTAVRAVDAVFPEEQFSVLLGPSGCGKSTLLRMIAGLESLSSGTLSLGGQDLGAVPPSQRGIAMVFQSYALFPHLSVRDNILFGMKVRRTARELQQQKLDEALDLLGLRPVADRKPAQISGGQQQRVGLARAIVSGRKIYLMDEPLSNLDARLRDDMRREIRALQQKLGLTVIYVTHDQTEAMTMADQILIMKDGQLQQAGSPDDIYQRPANSFCAGFIGAPPMNLWDAVGLDSALCAQMGEVHGVVGLRPEHITLSSDDGARPVVSGRVETVETLGAEQLVDCVVGTTHVMVRSFGARVAVGQSVGLHWDRERLYHFTDHSH